MVYNFRKKKNRPFHFKGWSYSNFMDGGKSRKLHCLDNSALIVLWPWPIYLNFHLPKMSFWTVLWEFFTGWGENLSHKPKPFSKLIFLEKRKWGERLSTLTVCCGLTVCSLVITAQFYFTYESPNSKWILLLSEYNRAILWLFPWNIK